MVLCEALNQSVDVYLTMIYTDGFFLGRSSWRNSVVCSNDIFDHLHISRKVVNPWSRVYKQDHLVTFGSIRDLRYDYYRFSFWPEGQLDGLPVKGLALGDYTLMPLWIWIYCLIWWFIQVPRNNLIWKAHNLSAIACCAGCNEGGNYSILYVSQILQAFPGLDFCKRFRSLVISVC